MTSTTDNSAKPLSLKLKFFWGVGQIGEGVKNSAFNSFLLFYYNQILGVSATLTSIALAVAIAFDAISDPVAGSISDRFQSRWGRRHPFMFASAAPLGITLFLLFFPPEGMSEMFYFGWVLVFAVAVRTFLTLYHIPHLALGAEMAADYNDRNSIFSFGLLFGAAAGYGFYFSMLTFVFPPQEGLANGMYYADGYPVMAASAGLVAFVAILVCTWGTKSQIPNLSQATPATTAFGPKRLFGELATAFSSPSYRSIFFGLLLLTLVLSIEGVFSPFMGIHFWGLETDQLRLLPIGVLFGLPVGAVVATYMVRLFDKKWCLAVGTIISLISVNWMIVLRLLDILPANGHPVILPLLMMSSFISAILVPVVFITINSMFADIADELELKTGERQEGIIYSARAFAGKAAAALGTVIGGIALDFISFPKNAVPGEIPADIIFNLGLFQGPLTSMCNLVAVVLFFRYTLTRQKHQQIVDALALKASN